MEEKHVIVLHEVDYKLRGALDVLAHQYEYGMVSQGHGYWRNWHMGSAILWPREFYKLKQSEYITVGDLIKQNVLDPTPRTGWLEGWVWWALTPITVPHRWMTNAKEPVNHYRKAVGRSNVLFHVQLMDRNAEDKDVDTEDDDDVVNVWAYHMPCAFREPKIMQYHANEVVRSVHNADEGWHVLCMDGNFQPYTELYNTFVEAGFTSAAFEANGEEPIWTCRSNSCWSGAFIGTLDYAWFINTGTAQNNYQWSVEFAQLDSEEEEEHYLPTTTFPSDHLWMNVNITGR
jgi:hypothetical protein